MKKIGLLPRIIIAIILGVLTGNVLPEMWVRVFVTFNYVFSQFLGFLIPLIIIGLVTPAIADIGRGAGRLLLLTVGLVCLLQRRPATAEDLRRPTALAARSWRSRDTSLCQSWQDLHRTGVPGCLHHPQAPRTTQLDCPLASATLQRQCRALSKADEGHQEISALDSFSKRPNNLT